ncbi:unnamed protein product, partial [Brenthis ino]
MTQYGGDMNAYRATSLNRIASSYDSMSFVLSKCETDGIEDAPVLVALWDRRTAPKYPQQVEFLLKSLATMTDIVLPALETTN